MRTHQRLLYAINSSNYECIDRLISRGLDLNSFFLSPLVDAMDANLPEMVKFLLSRGADPNHREQETGNSVLFYALESENPLLFTRILLQAGVDPNLQNRDGNTLLMEIVRDLQFRPYLTDVIPDIVLLLFQKDARDLENNEGETLWDLAERHPSVLSRMLQR